MTIRAIISRAEAKARGLKRYFTGIPCSRGHVSERRVSNVSCVTCTSYSERPEAKKIKSKIKVKNRRLQQKITINELKKACVRCGFDHPGALHFHHTRDKTAKVSGMLHYKGISVVMAEMDKCIVLCANCHAIEHWDQAQNKKGVA